MTSIQPAATCCLALNCIQVPTGAINSMLELLEATPLCSNPKQCCTMSCRDIEAQGDGHKGWTCGDMQGGATCRSSAGDWGAALRRKAAQLRQRSTAAAPAVKVKRQHSRPAVRVAQLSSCSTAPALHCSRSCSQDQATAQPPAAPPAMLTVLPSSCSCNVTIAAAAAPRGSAPSLVGQPHLTLAVATMSCTSSQISSARVLLLL